MKNSLIALKFFILFSLITGFAYPFLVTGAAQALFPAKANGSLLIVKDQIVGSDLIAQGFKKPEYFWPRPSAVDYNPMPSGGSNLGPTSQDLKETIGKRQAQGLSDDLLYASASGLDPHISPQAAADQMERVAKSRGLSETQKEELRKRIALYTEGRQWGFLGEPRVNVLKLNQDLDKGI